MKKLAVAMPGIFEWSFAVLVRPRIGRASQRPIAMIETVCVGNPLRFRAEMPLAHLIGVIPDGLECRSHRHRAERHCP